MKTPWYLKAMPPLYDKKKKKMYTTVSMRKIYIVWLFIKTFFRVLFSRKKRIK